jgi:ergothioneine biosynthesis protein EgtB
VLSPYFKKYTIFNESYSYLFNSYYNNAGQRINRINRGLITRPGVEEIFSYRTYVTDAVNDFFSCIEDESVLDLIQLGINHEQQHQELLIYDIKYILGHQAGFPSYGGGLEHRFESEVNNIHISEGIYEVGSDGSVFCFDNETPKHKEYLHNFTISGSLVKNGEFIEFMNAGGYKNFNVWLSDGWDYINNEEITSPLYWHSIDGTWWNYTLDGLRKVDENLPVQHISFYEAAAFADWKGCRLPTEFEWEVAAPNFKCGSLWEWTYSSYHPYPGFKKEPGALGEYNGKFMINQNVLRGASLATSEGHSRITYRNFFPLHSRWIYSGARLVL